MKQVIEQYRKSKKKHLDDLIRLVKIPSVSFPGYDSKEVVRSAEAVASLLKSTGLDNVQLLYAKDNPRPYVYGDWLKKPGAPTLLLYAHHDVQPPGDVEKWKTEPFDPVELNGRLYGRGAADDKAGIIVHTAALSSWLESTGGLPVNVKLLIEGEEEIGSPGLESFLMERKDFLKSDVLVLTDTENFSTDRGGLTVALRGITCLDVEVHGLHQSVHSGMWGGPIPDPALALSKMLAKLTDDQGKITVPGVLDNLIPLSEGQKKTLEKTSIDEEVFKKQVGLLEGVPLLPHEGNVKGQVWFYPTLAINAIQASSRKNASNIINASAWAKVSVRLVPNMDPKDVFEKMKSYLEKSCPFGLRVEIKEDGLGGWWTTDTKHPAFSAAKKAMDEAWGKETVFMGCGGSIPFVQPFSNALKAPALLIGVEDPETKAHSENESLHIGVLEKSIESCIRLYTYISDIPV